MGENKVGKVFYFFGVIILIYLAIKNPSTFNTGWLLLYLLVGIIMVRNSLALTVFFAINILLALVLYVQHGYLKFVGLLLVALIGFIASIGSVKPKRIRRPVRKEVRLERKAEQIKKELDGIENKVPSVQVYGKKEAKKTTKRKKTKRKTKKKTTKKKATKKKSKKRTAKKKTTKRKAKKKSSKRKTKRKKKR
jgi:hypothetical protein